MIETLRLGTRVVTDNPTWPHIRKIADTSRHTRYVFTRPGLAEVIVDVHKPATPGGLVRLVLPAGASLAEPLLNVLVAHVTDDLLALGRPDAVVVLADHPKCHFD